MTSHLAQPTLILHLLFFDDYFIVNIGVGVGVSFIYLFFITDGLFSYVCQNFMDLGEGCGFFKFE
jgi:hypothetical protein